jgi:hypothetical protein
MASTTGESRRDPDARAVAAWLLKNGPQVLTAFVRALQPTPGFVADPETSTVDAPTVLSDRGQPAGGEASSLPSPTDARTAILAALLDEDPLPDHATPFLCGQPVPLRLTGSEIAQRAEGFAAAGAVVVAPIRVGIPFALAAAWPDAFALRFPSGAVTGVTARVVLGEPGGSAVEFANPIELIDPRIDEAPVGEQEVTLFAFQRGGSPGDGA